MRGLGSPLAGSTAAPSAIFRDSASQHSLLQSQELDGDPMQALALMGAHASHQVPIFAHTLEVQPRTAGSALSSFPSSRPQSRRSSLSRFALETDEEDDQGQLHAAFGGHSGGGSMHILPHASLGPSTLSSTATTPTASTALQTPSSAASSVPTSPMRNLHFFPSAPKIVTTLVPSPRMTSLQMAGRKAAAMREALRAAGHAADAAEEGDADAEMSSGFTPGSSAPSSRPQSHKKNKRSLATHAEAFSEQARKRKKSKKRSRPAQLGPTAVAEAAAAGGDAEEPLLARAASALERASRIGRRKSVPPTHYGDGDNDSGALGSASTRRRAATDPTGLAGAPAESDEEEELDQPPSPPKNKECEQCHKKHAGTYGGGRFCCAHCARHFSIVRRWDKKQGR